MGRNHVADGLRIRDGQTIAEYASYRSSVTVVPIFDTFSARQVHSILQQTRPKVVFLSSAKLALVTRMQRIRMDEAESEDRSLADELADAESPKWLDDAEMFYVCFEGDVKREVLGDCKRLGMKVMKFDDLEKRGRKVKESEKGKAAIQNLVWPTLDVISCITYSSGTAGESFAKHQVERGS